jgi:hypothetical protein
MPRYIQNKDVAWRVVDSEAVLVKPQESRVVVLNETAGHLWEFLDKARTEEECVRSLTDNFKVDKAAAAADVREFLDEFLARDLVHTLGDKDG